MPPSLSDDSAVLAAPAAAAVATGRTGRAQVVAFVNDPATEAALRLGLLATSSDELTIYHGDCRSAIAVMRRIASPRVLVVDISGDEQPMSTLTALSDVVEPDVRVLVVGDQQGVDLYRQLTRTLGVGEYLYKPLNAEVVALHFGPFVNSVGTATTQPLGGRILTLSGVCGGAGATTLAANIAWFMATEAKRHTVLLDANLYTGTAALLLEAKTGGGLRLALETPERFDALFMERIAQPAAERLSVIASEEQLGDPISVADGAVRRLLQGLRQRYNYVVIDVPLAPLPWCADLLDQARQRVLVMEPTLQAVRDVLRFVALPMGSQQIRQALIVLNKLGVPGTMTLSQVEAALQRKVDAVVPFLPRAVNAAASVGTPAAASGGAFRTAIAALAQKVSAAGTPAVPRSRLAALFRRGTAQ